MTSIYSYIIYPLLHLAFLTLSFFNPKIRKGFQIRRKRAWIKKIPAGSSWVWFHVASGELEYAKPVIRELKKNPNFKSKILVTFFSPSVLPSLTKTPEVDLFVPMPWDTPWHWNQFLKHYEPKVLAISRTDTWPNLVWQTKKMKIPSILFSATLPRQSGRVSSFWGRLFYASIFEDLTQISVVAEEDRENFLRLSEALPVSIDGDTRFDQAISRVEEKRDLPHWLNQISTPLFIAGSTWSEDERILVPAVSDALKIKKLTVLFAPHEPTENHLRELERNFSALNLKTVRFSQVRDTNLCSIILVDKVGILADLYRFAQVAFVGGSFKKSVHSVMEPAASGCATFFGPYFTNNREAIALARERLAFEFNSKQDICDFLVRQFSLSQNEVQSQRERIFKFVDGNRGVSQKIARWISEHS